MSHGIKVYGQHCMEPLLKVKVKGENGYMRLCIIACILVYFNIVQPHWYVKRWRGFVKHHFGHSRSFSENVNNS